MNYKKRITAVLLAVGVLCGTLPAAGAVSHAGIQVGTEGGSVLISLSGIEAGDTVCSVQLGLSGLSSKPEFTINDAFGDPNDVSSGLYCSEKYDRGTYTIYITNKTALNDGTNLMLGSLTAEGGVNLEGTKASLILLDGAAKVLYRSAEGGIIPDESTGGNTGDTPGGSTGGSGSGSTDKDKDDSTQSDKTERKVSVSAGTGGTVKVTPTRAKKGDTVTLTVTANSGYVLAGLTVTDSRGKEITLRDRGNGKYTFTMPAYEIDIEAEFVLAGAAPAEQPPQFAPMSFGDVAAGEWYYSAVEFVYRHGMMSGTSAGAFSPHTPTDRAMIVSILHRLEGSPSAPAASFPDVAAGQYYANAVAWASANGIVSGYSTGEFRPGDGITREQLASILYRYAAQKGYDTTSTATLTGFTDSAKVSPYAAEAMRWAVGKGLISGTSGGALAPSAGATRAEAAAILMRFCQNLAGMQ